MVPSGCGSRALSITQECGAAWGANVGWGKEKNQGLVPPLELEERW